ncbi:MULTISPECIES: OmpA/MotB family protein [Aequorivita]|jgi:chemotaxis protein MotB|uniref:OmpA family protein n=2 Tax=Aequorivita TaxID=153265 RepID=A0AB35YPQ6_9FLAO|nr:OmpA family protein [Aequorivita sp. Ant34-E75]WGF91455.1 OmpA family protein [Aequorivita sp. Ant34-E75]
MKKLLILAVCSSLAFTSCVSKKKYAELEAKQQTTQDLLNTATVKLNDCLAERAALNAKASQLEARLADMKKTNEELIQSSKDLTMLTSKGATNLEKSLESLKEKDLKITRLQDALNKKDSVTLALVTSLKREVGINDPDIEINVEKGVVYISLSDKVLFKTGSYQISSRANEILGKVAKVINGKPDFEAMVEGHTDNVPYGKRGELLDNWDLSVKRATAIVRALQDLGIAPERLVAAGRGEYDPLVPNTTAENRAKNRRTRILVLPKIDQFYDMIEKEMKNLEAGG